MHHAYVCGLDPDLLLNGIPLMKLCKQYYDVNLSLCKHWLWRIIITLHDSK